jgi:alcohol dehydrogenase, propanol-preferring
MISYDVTAFGRSLELIERPTPRPDGEEVLLRVLATGVCHTDIHVWSGSYDLGGGRKLDMAGRGVSLPLTLGHEIVGEVIAVGPNADPAIKSQRCLVYPWIGCGSCNTCSRGREHLCTSPRSLGVFRAGGYSDHVVVPHARYLLPIGDLRPEEAAPYACAGLTTYSAIQKIDQYVLKHERIVVIGAGGLGLMCISLLKSLGAVGSIVVEVDALRRAAAMAAGATVAMRHPDAELTQHTKAAAGGAAWVVIDFVGSPQTIQLGLDLLAKGGQLIVVGLFGGEITVPIPPIPLRAISIQGSFLGSLAELQELLKLVRSACIKPIPVTCRSLHEAADALRDLEQGRVVGRLILQPPFQLGAR